MPRGGAQKLTDALVAHLARSVGRWWPIADHVVWTNCRPHAPCLCDLSAASFSSRRRTTIAGDVSPQPGALSIRDGRLQSRLGARRSDTVACGGMRRAPGPVHVCGTLDELVKSERDRVDRAPWSERPFVLLVQPTLFDSSRAPAGKHTAWAYCHVPAGSTADMLPRHRGQIERLRRASAIEFLARSVMTPRTSRRTTRISSPATSVAGVVDLRQFFTRPTWRHTRRPFAVCTSVRRRRRPGVGVHGMCGYFAAQRAIADARCVARCCSQRSPPISTTDDGWRVPSPSDCRSCHV
jgi:phytoene dehydrogenase-like protein